MEGRTRHKGEVKKKMAELITHKCPKCGARDIEPDKKSVGTYTCLKCGFTSDEYEFEEKVTLNEFQRARKESPAT